MSLIPVGYKCYKVIRL